MHIWDVSGLMKGMTLATGPARLVFWCDVAEDGQIVSQQPWPSALPVGCDFPAGLVGHFSEQPVREALEMAASSRNPVPSVLCLDGDSPCAPLQINVLPLKPGLARLVLFFEPATLVTAVDPIPRLTRRETAILDLLAAGFRRDGIAWELNISLPTVDMHGRNLRRKLGATTMSEAVANAARHGLIGKSRYAPTTSS